MDEEAASRTSGMGTGARRRGRGPLRVRPTSRKEGAYMTRRLRPSETSCKKARIPTPRLSAIRFGTSRRWGPEPGTVLRVRHSATPRRWLLKLSRLRPHMEAHSAHQVSASRAAGKREETSRPSGVTRTNSLKSILEVFLSPSRVRALARVWRAGHQMNLEKVWADAARGRSDGDGGRSGGETVTRRGTREKCGCHGS